MICLSVGIWYIKRLKLAFLPLGQLPSIYILLVYNTYRYCRITSIGVSDYLTDFGISIRGPRRLSCRGFRRLKPPPLRASLSLSEARVTAWFLASITGDCRLLFPRFFRCN